MNVLLRVLLILSLLLQPMAYVSASACGASAPSATQSQTCCCFGAISGAMDAAHYCGCLIDRAPSQAPAAPPAVPVDGRDASSVPQLVPHVLPPLPMPPVVQSIPASAEFVHPISSDRPQALTCVWRT